MKTFPLTHSPRAIARGLQVLVLAGCLVAGAGLGRSVAHAASPATTPIPIPSPGCYRSHEVVTASAYTHTLTATVHVAGRCFPIFSTAHISVSDLTRGKVLARSAPVRVSWVGEFAYQVPGAYANDRVRIRVSDSGWHGTVTIQVREVIP
jgi:hypothetical protein